MGGSDIATGLQNGQVITVPRGVNLDVWAEITRLETDRARLSVNWGNGNSDFINCGSCKLENVYSNEGRYTLTIRITDLNAPADSATITSIAVTLNVVESSLKCDEIRNGFDGLSGAGPFTFNGFSVDGPGVGGGSVGIPSPFLPLLGEYPYAYGPLTFTFTSDKNYISLGVLAEPGQTVTYQARSVDGSVVASGTVSTTAVTGGYLGGVFTVLGPTFRSVVVTSSGTISWADGLLAGCR